MSTDRVQLVVVISYVPSGDDSTLLAFKDALADPDSSLLDDIRQRNPDVESVLYIGKINTAHSFSVVFSLPAGAMGAPDEAQQGSGDPKNPLASIGLKDWNFSILTLGGHPMGEQALYAALDRIFWIPPEPPRIIGSYDIAYGIVVYEDESYGMNLGGPGSGGRGGGNG